MFSFSSSIFLFWPMSISSSWLIVSAWYDCWSEKSTWFCSYSDSDPSLFSYYLAASSSFLYLLMRLYFCKSSSFNGSKIPLSCSQAQNKYLTTLGNERSIMLLNKLLTKFFLSTPYEPDLILNYAIMLLISAFD